MNTPAAIRAAECMPEDHRALTACTPPGFAVRATTDARIAM